MLRRDALLSGVVVGGLGLAATNADAATPSANVRLMNAAAVAASSSLRVHRVAGASEIPAEFYGVDYPAGSVPSVFTNGFLTITNGTSWVAVWAPGQWSRIEVM